MLAIQLAIVPMEEDLATHVATRMGCSPAGDIGS